MSVHEQLSRQFYEWEVRGRGWQVWPEPVWPEPFFRPLRYYLPETVDDGRRPSFFGKILRGLRSYGPESTPPVYPLETEQPAPLIRENLIELQTRLPSDIDLRTETSASFLRNLFLAQEPISFELLGISSGVLLQFVAHPDDVPHLRRQLSAYFPEALFQPAESRLENLWPTNEGHESLVIEFGLAKEFVLPLTVSKLDPFVGIVGALSEIAPDELGLFQVTFQVVKNPWADCIVEALALSDGKPRFVNYPELTAAAEKKVQHPLFAAVVRVGVKSASYLRSEQIACDLAASLGVFGEPGGNQLIPLSNDEYPLEEHVEDLLRRQSRRSGMIINSEELIGFVHLPSNAIRSPALVRDTGKTKMAPKQFTIGAGLCLGENSHLGKTAKVYLGPEARVRHMHVIGASGTGKSTLLFNLIRQDIERGEGVGVLDPHGELVDRILGIIPPERIRDVVVFDPSDEEYPIGFNILSAHSELEKTLLASDLVSIFERLSKSWGDQMASVLNNAIRAFLESNRGGTLAEMRRFLLEPAFRNEFLKTVRDPDIVYYWHKGFTQLAGNKSIGPVLTRLETFLSPKPLRYVVSQKENRLDFDSILDCGKILLVKLSQGAIGKENSFLMGSLLVAKLQQTAMSRQRQSAEARRDFWLYLDEFHNFITASLAEILTGARKYRMGLILAHQELRQLQRESEVAAAVLANPYTRICFRVGDDDARKLADGFSYFEKRDLQNLGIGQAICRVERSDFDFNLTVPLLLDPAENDAVQRRQAVVGASRRAYGTPRADVERILYQNLETEEANPAPKPPPAKPKITPQPHPPEAPAPTKPAESAKEMSHLGSPPEPAPENVDEQLQEEIKHRIGQEAESLDYTVTFEESVLSGAGRIDIVLRRAKRVIACEICVRNTLEYELGNVRKCLEAGFKQVVVLCPNRTKLGRIRETVAAALPAEQISLVTCQLPGEFLRKLFEWASDDPEGGAAERGKRRKQQITLNTCALGEDERKQQEKSMLQKLAQAMNSKRQP